MGTGSSTTKKKNNPNKKADNFAFAENPEIYKNNMKNIPQERNKGKHKSIVLQRRYRDDSIAEESVSIRTETPEQKTKTTPVVPNNTVNTTKPKTKTKTKKPLNNNNNSTVKPKDKPVKITKVKEPSVEEEELPPVVVDKPQDNNPRQRRYRPYQPIGNVKNRTRQRLLRKPNNINNTTAPSVASSIESLSNDDDDIKPVDTNYKIHRPRFNNSTFTNFNKTYRTTTRTGFCQCDSNTCRQCGLTRMNASSCCCSCSCSCSYSCNQNRCSCPLKVSHYRTCPYNYSTPLITYDSMPKVIKEKTYVIKDLPRINYVPVRDPLMYNVPYRSSLYKWNVKVNGDDIGLRLPNVIRYDNEGFKRYRSEKKFDVLNDNYNCEDDEIRSAVVITPRYKWSTLSYG